MRRSQLLLPPATPAHSRIWITVPGGIDAAANAAEAVTAFGNPAHPDPDPLTVGNPDGGLDTYTTAIPIFTALYDRLAATDMADDLTEMVRAMREARSVEAKLDATGGLEEATQHNGDALAALRRVSRESAESSTLIDRSARRFNAALRRLSHSHVVIVNAERIDRPSLKILARACLITPAEKPPVWIWTQAALAKPVASACFDARTELPLRARHSILSAIRAVLEPTEIMRPAASTAALSPPVRAATRAGIGAATGRLANLNYDGCAQWLAECTEPDIDTCRLTALLMVNLGLHDAAIDTLSHAIGRCETATLECHMWYIAGLVWSKRCYDVDQSTVCFDRAETALEQIRSNDPGDADMERAWVRNGRAMNAILAARFSGRPVRDAFPLAFNHLRQAFELVRQGATRDRIYLRYNLLGNMSSLMEIGGNHSVALDLLSQTFDESLARGRSNEREWLAQQRCMRAALMARAGDIADAVPVFAEARALMIETDRPVSAEALGRSEATARFQSGDVDGAQQVFAQCLTEAQALRSRLGVETHAAGLAACHMASGQPADAIALLREIGKAEGVWPVDEDALDRDDLSGLRIVDTYYGLSLSMPEVDLEDMAPASIAGALRGRQSEVAAARAAER